MNSRNSRFLQQNGLRPQSQTRPTTDLSEEIFSTDFADFTDWEWGTRRVACCCGARTQCAALRGIGAYVGRHLACHGGQTGRTQGPALRQREPAHWGATSCRAGRAPAISPPNRNPNRNPDRNLDRYPDHASTTIMTTMMITITITIQTNVRCRCFRGCSFDVGPACSLALRARAGRRSMLDVRLDGAPAGSTSESRSLVCPLSPTGR
mgnify:CR=1 FL=1